MIDQELCRMGLLLKDKSTQNNYLRAPENDTLHGFNGMKGLRSNTGG